ncbi:hypothetical protein C8R43DRAFT_966787 [Mycena crocata]|nr:hypothetical protein C8R43DRAFT_966787 [Mycena crocata]
MRREHKNPSLSQSPQPGRTLPELPPELWTFLSTPLGPAAPLLPHPPPSPHHHHPFPTPVCPPSPKLAVTNLPSPPLSCSSQPPSSPGPTPASPRSVNPCGTSARWRSSRRSGIATRSPCCTRRCGSRVPRKQRRLRSRSSVITSQSRTRPPPPTLTRLQAPDASSAACTSRHPSSSGATLTVPHTVPSRIYVYLLLSRTLGQLYCIVAY